MMITRPLLQVTWRVSRIKLTLYTHVHHSRRSLCLPRFKSCLAGRTLDESSFSNPVLKTNATNTNHEDFDSFENENVLRNMNNESKDITERMYALQEKARKLSHVSDLNINSYKQISQALFNDPSKSTSRQDLMNIVKESNMNESNSTLAFQRELAMTVLEYRRLKALQNNFKDDDDSASRNSTTTNSYSNIPSTQSIMRNYSTGISVSSISSNTTATEVQAKTMIVTKGGIINHYRHQVHSLFTPNIEKSSRFLDTYWKEPLELIRKPSARALVTQLDPSCPMGYNPQSVTAAKKGSLLAYVREQKQKYPDCIIVTRVGEFYETYGVDAIMLVEHCGLNAMGGKARAGCPAQNLQATLTSLVSAGFRMAVYEEANDTVNTGQIKNRFLTQFVSSSNPTYMYNAVLDDSGRTSDNLFGTPYARPFTGVIHTAAGYTIVEISLEEQQVRVMERLTAEAVACQLANNPPADPLFYIPSPLEGKTIRKDSLPFLPSGWGSERDGLVSRSHISVLPSSVHLSAASERQCDMERAKDAILNNLLQTNQIYISERKSLTARDFTLVSPSMWKADSSIETGPLYADTASQLGLMQLPTIPPLTRYLLPIGAPQGCYRFLRRWLLTPPPSDVAYAMSQLVSCVKDEDSLSLPEFDLAPVGKVLQYIRAGEAGAQVFRETVASLKNTVSVIDICDDHQLRQNELILPLMKVLKFESGLEATPSNLKNRCLDAIQIIEKVVSTGCTNALENDLDSIAYCNEVEVVPSRFFYNNEKNWRGRINPEAAPEIYKAVQDAATQLVNAVAVDFWGASNPHDISTAKASTNPIVQDMFNNLFALKSVPSWVEKNDKGKYYHPRDRNGKVLGNRYTTPLVADALSNYVEACQMATDKVREMLKELSVLLCETGHLPAISQSSHFNLILSTVSYHCKNANALGWSMAKIVDIKEGPDSSRCNFHQLTPYWMDRSEAVPNTFELDGMILLSSPNMAGKSTIMRSTAAAALLSACGFCAPVAPGTTIRKFDHLFLRGASADVPSENKSAFGAEMGDIAAMLRVCGDRSLVFVDELGRGTSPKDGTSLAAALLEWMAQKHMTGFFATHLHSIIDLPLSHEANRNIKKKQMEATNYGDDWTYRLIDGICRDSMALKTASKFGIPKDIINRAKSFASHLDESGLSCGIQSVSSNELESDQSFSAKDFDLAKKLTMLICNQEPSEVDPNWGVPASFEGGSCVYIFHVGGNSFYIGETDRISNRFRAHRQRNGFENAKAIIVKVPAGKTEARNIESRLIQRFVREGLVVLSKKDGKSISPRLR